MSEQEFCDSVDSLLSVTNEKLMGSLYRESALYVKQMDQPQGVPTQRLARECMVGDGHLGAQHTIYNVQFL